MNATPPAEFRECNFDGLVGPTHHYGGLSHGNPASIQNRSLISYPRLAVRQGLAKMRCLVELGVGQALVPPLHRPQLKMLRRVGFTGDDQQLIERAWRDAPELVSASFSASGMWTASVVTVAPSCDTSEGRVHFTTANLIANLHRASEAKETANLWQTLFPNPELFVHHPPLPRTLAFGDEGAANHGRLVGRTEQRGIHLFVYGREYFRHTRPTLFPQNRTPEPPKQSLRFLKPAPTKPSLPHQNPDPSNAAPFPTNVPHTPPTNLLF